MIGSMPRAASAATADSPMAPAPIDERHLAGLRSATAHVELADRERVDQRDRVVGHAVRAPRAPSSRTTSNSSPKLPGASGCWPITRAPAPSPISDRHGGHPRADREVVRAARTVADDLADELVTHDDVAVGVPHEPRRAEFGWSM